MAGCLAFIGLHGAFADDVGDAVRAATRRDTTAATVLSRQKSTPTPVATSRNSAPKTSGIVNRNSGTNRAATVVNRATEQSATTSANVVARTTGATRTQNDQNTLKTRTARTTKTRSLPRATSTRAATRSATTYATRQDILNRNYATCKEVFNSCMDEFCANKDGQLKRCACSARVNDFDRIKKQLNDVDDKMLDFNQRLLTVSMDEKDVAAINVETEGEKAFYDTKDVSESKRTLDAIAKKLNIDFDSNKFASPIGNVLSWSLDIDSVFDNIDSLRGASTAAKSGTALYSAALPVCREMAAEICSEEDLGIAESGYQLLIDYDCDTVEKTYKTAAEQARQKVLESSALLDISRLNSYQKNNADDILTCKKKMLTMLSDSTVCGENLGKCLDITGQYIDPSTGEAFLSAELSDLANLITRPDDNQSWTTAPGNSVFVSFLNSKKKFLEPAMENCQDISDTVWNTFIEDAMSQIKIAQIRKLEEVRQSCTTLTAQCLSDTMESIENFDARALSTFGVHADATVNAMCDSVLSACTTLLNTTDTDMEWYRGMYGIQTDMTYDTIKHTCREVGKACIIQVCTSTSGNFGLCENIDTSINRKSIINHTACWDEVQECVQSAGAETIQSIFTQNGLDTTDRYAFYDAIYRIDDPTITRDESPYNTTCASTPTENNSCIFDMCYTECNGFAYQDTNECRVCRIAESIWGNCESEPTTLLTKSNMHNRIKTPYSESNHTLSDSEKTLLYWFAQNTGTEDNAESCRDTTCPAGFFPALDVATQTIICGNSNDYTDDGVMCVGTNATQISVGTNGNSAITNCCTGGVQDSTYNCCDNDQSVPGTDVCAPDGGMQLFATFTILETQADSYYPAGDYQMYCTGNVRTDTDPGPICDGAFIIVKTGSPLQYMSPKYTNDRPPYVRETFKTDSDTEYTREYKNDAWGWYNGQTQYPGITGSYFVTYGQ